MDSTKNSGTETVMRLQPDCGGGICDAILSLGTICENYVIAPHRADS